MIFCFSASFMACGKGGKDNIALSLDNYEEYINIDSVNIYGDGNSYWSSYNSEFMYSHAAAKATISGVPICQYIDVTVKIKVNFSFGGTAFTIPLDVKLNIGGAGSQTDSIKLDQYWASSWIKKYAAYEVESVSGSVKLLVQ